jgi:hypothetical protein
MRHLAVALLVIALVLAIPVVMSLATERPMTLGLPPTETPEYP